MIFRYVIQKWSYKENKWVDIENVRQLEYVNYKKIREIAKKEKTYFRILEVKDIFLYD